MASISLALFKKHCRADDFADDNTYMQHLLDTAEASVIRATGCTFDELAGDSEQLPLELQTAVLMLGAHWFNNREAVAGVNMVEVPYTMQALIKPFRKLSTTE